MQNLSVSPCEMAGAWFVLVASPKILAWLFSARHYEDRGLYLRLTLTAIWDGLTGNYARSHDTVMDLSRR